MVDFRPLNALRYDTAIAGPAQDLVSPPYDVVNAEETAALHARSPYNIARVDYGVTLPGDDDVENRYARAKRDLAGWRAKGVLRRDETPRLYVYDQEFTLRGRTLRRRAVFGRLRLESWDSGNILPHEHTGAAAKEDRRRLLEATRTHLSPIMALYDTPGVSAFLQEDAIEEPVFDAELPGERHTLRPLAPAAAAAFCAALASARLYIADGHHRYETALGYRDRTRAAAPSWTGEEPENFVLAALIAADEPGLVVLPIHRLLKLAAVSAEARRRLEKMYTVETTPAANDGALERLMQALTIAGEKGGAFAAAGLEEGKLSLLLPKALALIDSMVPAAKPPVWRSLDVATLHYAVLPALGFTESPESLAFTEDHEEALAEVTSGAWDATFLLNPTRVTQIIEVANAGERMPQKSTYFYPKLGTGILMLPMD
jgi:uncharacterized protein (DUF1015 family)